MEKVTSNANILNKENKSFFGLLQCSILEGDNIRKKKSKRRFYAGCTDSFRFFCSTKRSSLRTICVVDLNLFGNIYRLGRTHSSRKGYFPKWNHTFSVPIHIDYKLQKEIINLLKCKGILGDGNYGSLKNLHSKFPTSTRTTTDLLDTVNLNDSASRVTSEALNKTSSTDSVDNDYFGNKPEFSGYVMTVNSPKPELTLQSHVFGNSEQEVCDNDTVELIFTIVSAAKRRSRFYHHKQKKSATDEIIATGKANFLHLLAQPHMKLWLYMFRNEAERQEMIEKTKSFPNENCDIADENTVINNNISDKCNYCVEYNESKNVDSLSNVVNNSNSDIVLCSNNSMLVNTNIQTTNQPIAKPACKHCSFAESDIYIQPRGQANSINTVKCSPYQSCDSKKSSEHLTNEPHRSRLMTRGMTRRIKVFSRQHFSNYMNFLQKLTHSATYYSRILVELKLHPVDTKSLTNASLKNNYFPNTHGNIVKFYNDAMKSNEPTPRVFTELGPYNTTSAWEDMYNDLNDAKYFIYITGWSINPDIHLIRSSDSATVGETLGELLLRKAAEGVIVVLMIWADITSRENIRFLRTGIMNAYHLYVEQYFSKSSVMVTSVRRTSLDDTRSMREILRHTVFTHHQKLVLCDVSVTQESAKRCVAAYIGGLDLTIGRFDIPAHSLFSTLNTYHVHDFYSNCVPLTNAKNPRQPWHDIHSRIVGAAAWHLLDNYNERIARQAHRLLPHVLSFVESLVSKGLLHSRHKIINMLPLKHHFDIQVFRSIDSCDSVFLNYRWRLKNKWADGYVDRSAQLAYCYYILNAKSFIYMENQYFIGSSQFWNHDSAPTALNLVPYSLGMRVCKAIENDESFKIYLVLPLYPEGITTSMNTQEILRLQYYSLNVVFTLIEAKLQLRNSTKTASDYFRVFFLGKREHIPNTAPNETFSHQIYVHSKLAIFDDETLFIGSVNINERSLNGSRDSEILAVISQPSMRCYKCDKSNSIITPRGDIYGFRKTLWYEHMKLDLDSFDYPARDFCWDTVRKVAESNLAHYECRVDYNPQTSHLCWYPLNAETINSQDPVPIPGAPGYMQGSLSNILPNGLTC